MTHAPRRRDYGPTRGNPRGVGDDAERLRMLGTLVFGFGLGTIWGFFLLGFSGLLALLVGGPIGAAFVFVVVRLWTGAFGTAVGGTLLPSGGTTAYRRQYSDAEACAARGDYAQAVSAYQRYVLELPSDPDPYLHIARICRDHLGDHGAAAEWFRRVRREATLDRGRELLATQELIELYIHRLKEPRKAIPELARLVERFTGTPPAQAASAELARLRELLAAERDDGGESLTGRFYKG